MDGEASIGGWGHTQQRPQDSAVLGVSIAFRFGMKILINNYAFDSVGREEKRLINYGFVICVCCCELQREMDRKER